MWPLVTFELRPLAAGEIMIDREPIEGDDEEVTLPDDEQEGEDSGQLDNEGGDESEAGQELEDAQAEERVGRAGKRIQTLRREAQEATERAARFERELNEERQRYRQPVQQGETPEQEQARLALMTTEERVDYKLNKAREENARQLRIMQFQTLDMQDRAAFAAKTASDSVARKYAAEVEQLLQSERQAGRGFDLSRETVYYYLRGRKAATNPTKDAQKERGKENVRKQQARADSGRSDVSNSRRREDDGDSLEAIKRRLMGVNI